MPKTNIMSYRLCEGGWIHITFNLGEVSCSNMIESLKSTLDIVAKRQHNFFTQKEWESLFEMVDNLCARKLQEKAHSPWITSIKCMSGVKRLVVCEWTLSSIVKAILSAPCRWIAAGVALAFVGWWSKPTLHGIKALMYPELLALSGSEQILETNFSQFGVRSFPAGKSNHLNLNLSIVKVG